MDSSLSLLTCFCAAAVTLCHGFSVDTEHPITFQETAGGFGQSIVPFGRGANAGLLIGAPLQKGNVNETGKLYQCLTMPSKSARCQEVQVQKPIDAVNMSFSLSLSARDSQLLACGPTVHQTCGENTYLKGYCFLLDENLRQIKHFPDVLPECPKRLIDIVLLIDGSGSILSHQFMQVKTFVTKIMKRFQNSNTQFALAQYSNKYKEHFDFNQFRNNPDPERLLRPVEQLHGRTSTATYIQKVVRELFLPQKGSRSGATKILIVITDGRKTDRLEYRDVIPEAEQAGIIRYAIGVGNAFVTDEAKKELNDIASEPDKDHVFSVENFDALSGIENQLQDKIFAIEGTKTQSSTSFQLEMAQEGFSALLTPDGFVLGAVGAYDWSGGLFIYENNGAPNFVRVSNTYKDMNDAYFGYSVQSVQVNAVRSYVVGAPRYQHAGMVVLFSQMNQKWKPTQELFLKPIGSYFGATLCSVDVDGDSNTDLVLVGAPMYYDGVAGGRVYICQRQGDRFRCSRELQGQARHPLGRFGASIADIGDITGDRRTDVAIGAPMEDEDRGVLYIFQGDRSSISQEYSQRILGSQFPNQLRYFGQTVGAGTDLTGDGLPDVAVGAQAQVLVLRSRPVLQVSSKITFNPPTIAVSAFECRDQTFANKEVSKATVCLTVQLENSFTQGSRISNTVRYTLQLDPGRKNVRAAFDSRLSTLTKEMEMGLQTECMDFRIQLPVCVEDSLLPINLRLNYTLVGKPIPATNNLRAILSQDASSHFTALLPFDRDCGQDGICKDNLTTSFNFSGMNTLVVGQNLELNLTTFLQNGGEESYSTNLTFVYPSGLAYQRFRVMQTNRIYVNIRCSSVPALKEDSMRNATCNINHPIFRGGAKVIFIVTFSVSRDAKLGSEVQISAKASSENKNPITQGMFQDKLPVRYAIYISVNSIDESTKYVNFSTGQEDGNQTVEHRYEVKNSLQRKVPVSVKFWFPVQWNGIWIWNASLDIPSKQLPLNQCVPERETPASKASVMQLTENNIVDCSVATCKTIRCNISSLESYQALEFRIKGDVSFKWVSQTPQKKVNLVSSAQIFYDEKIYSQKEGFVQSKVKTMVELLAAYNYLPVIIGSSVAGLVVLALIVAALYKFGFFKRQYKQMMDVTDPDGQDGAGPSQGESTGAAAAAAGTES